MTWFLNLVYATALLLLSPVIIWRSLRHGRYRRGRKEKIFGWLPRANQQKPVVWFHAVSVGEVLQLQKVVERFQCDTNDRFQIVVTTSTDTGYDLAIDRFPRCAVSWFPLDFSWAVNAAIRRVQPKLVVLVELELWPNFLSACAAQNVKTALINARMSDRSFQRYSRLGSLIRSLFAGFSVVAAQTAEHADRLRKLGSDPDVTTVTGSVKFDGVLTDRTNAATTKLRTLFGISDSDVVLIAGSTQAPEEQMAIDAYRALIGDFSNLRLILVPRHRERFDEVAALVRSSQLKLQRRSELQVGDVVCHERIILLDTIGELAACWGIADVAFVGGSFGSRGGQNMLGPAAFGAAVMFGPKTRNFRDIVQQLLSVDGAIRLQSSADFCPELRRLLSDKRLRLEKGAAAKQLVEKQQGALQHTIDLLRNVVDCSDVKPQKAA